MKKIVVVFDNDNGDECMYVDGKAWSGTSQTTIYACDIAEWSEGKPFTLEHRPVDIGGIPWPKTLAKLEAAEKKFLSKRK